jgi:SAM-dependent methyltransferase
VVSADRERILNRLGLRPSAGELLRRALDDAIAAAEAVRPGAVIALDAGCGRISALAGFRPRLARITGVDLHRPPDRSLPHLDAFEVADLCRDRSAFADATFDVVLSSFTVEHFEDPGAAFATLRAWLRPGGKLVLSTVNRRHPFVALYLGLPRAIRGRLQGLVKRSAADAHPLVGACNDPRAIRAALTGAGFTEIRLEPVGHLARAWGRQLPTFALGLIGDLAAQAVPSRRSTIVAVATAGSGPGAAGDAR